MDFFNTEYQNFKENLHNINEIFPTYSASKGEQTKSSKVKKKSK